MTAVDVELEALARAARPEAPAAHVIEALSRVIRDMPGIGKTSEASREQGGYKYRGIESITAEAAPLFAKHGIVFVPNVVTWARDDVPVRDKVWHDDRLMVSYTVYGPGGIEDKIEVGPIACIGRDGTDKGTNKALTQAFKYALTQVLCIGDRSDDNDGQGVEAEYEPRSFSDDRAGQIRARIREIGKPAADWLNKEGPKPPWSDADCDVIEAKFAELA